MNCHVVEKAILRNPIAMISPNSVEAVNYSELGYSDLGDGYEEMKKLIVENKYIGRYY